MPNKKIITKTGPIFDKRVREDVVEVELTAGMEEALLFLEREVKERTPIGSTGILRGSIFSELRGKPVNIHGVVASSQEYAIAVEEGTKPHFPPVQAITGRPESLDLWVRRKLRVADDKVEGVALAIARKIDKRGTKETAAHMFRDALKDGENTVARIFEKRGFSIAVKLDG